MLIVLDNVLSDVQRQSVAEFFSANTAARDIKWKQGGVDSLQKDTSPMALLIKQASRFFDLSGMIGSERWAHYGTRPDWHVDKDEAQYNLSGEINHPICSIVYYANIDMDGGNFMTETATIKPVTNRMIIFAPGLNHGVDNFTGTRLSIAINPWVKKPLGYA